MSVDELLDAYASGQRDFHGVQMDGADLAGSDLTGASFFQASLKATNFRAARLTHVQFKAANLRGANLKDAELNATDMIGVNLRAADLSRADLTGAALQRANCRDANFRKAIFGNSRLGESVFTGAILDGTLLSSTDLSELDVSPFCDANKLKHTSASVVDARTVMYSVRHPELKRFMVDCGVPDIFAEFMIDCAKAEEGSLQSLMQSTFISYGGPDEGFARRLYDSLRAHQVVVFFFPETARLGERIDREILHQLQRHDRVILVCSQDSLNRPGVLHEIWETLDREAKDGGATYLLPVTIDNYLFSEWREKQPELAERIARRVIGDFQLAATSSAKYEQALSRLLDVLKVARPVA